MKKKTDGARLALLRGGKSPPEPTHHDPFAQVKWAFERRMQLKSVPSTEGKANYKTARSFLIKHLKAARGSAPYYIAEEWGEFCLLEMRDSILERRDAGEFRLGSFSMTGIFSALQQTVKNAASLGVLRTRTIQSIPVGAPEPETDAHSAYTDFELNQVVDALEKELAFSQAVARPALMPAESLGNDPRVPKKGKGWGYKPDANMRWYFVHVLGCRPVVGYGDDKTTHRSFLAAARTHHGGLHNPYRSWGVSALIDDNVIMPLVTWLNYVTGLNFSTLLAMDMDSYQESHPLTGAPYLRLNKPRSGGEIELHLPLLDGTPTIPLTGKQSVWVRRVVELTLKLTEPLRQRLPADHDGATRLFLYESSGAAAWRRVGPVGEKAAYGWRKRVAAAHKLRKADGSPMTFNHVRFRSTLLTRMVLAGRDLLEVKAVAAQKEMRTLFRYIARRQIDEAGRRRVVTALEHVRTNRREFPEVPAPKTGRKVIPIKVYKGLVSDCKNVFDPPASVRAMASYVEGQGCSKFNMCLLCHNVIVFRKHLPRLAMYRKQILSANTDDAPNASFYSATLDVLDNIFDPNFGEFTEEDTRWAEEESNFLNLVVDSAVYKPVMR